MTKKNWISWAVVASALALLVGCASGGAAVPAGPRDEEVLTSMMTDAMAALQAKDIEAMVASYADDFSSDNGDKAATIAFLQGAADQGFLDGIEIDTTGMSIDVEGDTAKAGPIGLEGAFGAISLSFDLAKRDGKWWVIGQSTAM